MTGLTLRYLHHHRVQTTVLVAGLAVVMILPLALHLLLGKYQRELTARADATPMVAGARGDRYDLVVNALYFATRSTGEIPRGQVDAIRATGRAAAVPLHARHTADGAPVVGTSLAYFERRGLRPAAGTLPLRLGDCVLGADVAETQELTVGDRIHSDQANLFDLTQYPLTMRVAGVLEPAGTADDGAVFTDLRTAWVLDGIGHGHNDLSDTNEAANVLRRDATNVVANARVVRHMEITDDTIGGFHLHGDPDTLPLTAILVFPPDRQNADILSARYNQSESHQLLAAPEVIGELLALVLRIKTWMRNLFVVFLGALLLFLALIVLQAHRLRRGERRTLRLLGCGRGQLARMALAEWAILLAASAALALAVSALVLALAPDLRQWLG